MKRVRIVLFLILISAAGAAPLAADDDISVAVMNFSAKDVPQETAVKISELIRNEMINSQAHRVPDLNAMNQAFLKAGFAPGACGTDECAIQAGVHLSVRYVIVGTVMKVGKRGSKIIISGRVVDVEKKKAVLSRQETVSSPEDVDEAIKPFCNVLSTGLIDKQGEFLESFGLHLSRHDVFIAYAPFFSLSAWGDYSDGTKYDNSYSSGSIYSFEYAVFLTANAGFRFRLGLYTFGEVESWDASTSSTVQSSASIGGTTVSLLYKYNFRGFVFSGGFTTFRTEEEDSNINWLFRAATLSASYNFYFDSFILAPEIEMGLGGGSYFNSSTNIAAEGEMMFYWTIYVRAGYRL
ncbi:MAG: porin [bacterium]|nr:porin [bacterium]